ncbi:hypothetical protein GCM10010912_29030 [Paenibacillus albidus]|uniref:Uncharacterized protein n=1 Tax=Paenibacillus albidus TaxID=2041023 RepID=A0A917FHP4_9BACL|nr:hypothetical protein [Paenibacillus albidus]GGF82083.1 hypothetical protein GCM10010912_29030 [Paenibacillus albidus]
MKFLPAAKRKTWFIWMIVYALLLWLLFAVHRFALLAQDFDLVILLRYALLALAVSLILHTFGWLGAKLLYLLATAGIGLGLVLMYAYTYRNMSGWEDLAGFLTFGFCMIGGFIIGLLAEGIRLLVQRSRKS